MCRTMTVFTCWGLALMSMACAVPTSTTDAEAVEIAVDEQALTPAAARTCPPRQCGPQLGLPNRICPDGTTVAGPTGRCLRQSDGSCGWEVIQCPNPVCVVVSFGAAGAETGFSARNFSTASGAKTWASQFSNSSVEILQGTCASQSFACPKIFQPVCAVVSGSTQATFGNRCELRSATIAAAGASGAAKSAVQSEGACPKACASSTQCEPDQHCSVEDGDCNRPPGCTPDRVCPALCYGICVPNPSEPPKGEFCGGIAGIPCPDGLECIDDPSDDCDPNNGGADCGGICVLAPNPCAAVLCMQGTQCIVVDGKPVCQPNGPTCGKRICGADQICCSPSCGICGTKGGLCPAIACVEPLQ